MVPFAAAFSFAISGGQAEKAALPSVCKKLASDAVAHGACSLFSRIISKGRVFRLEIYFQSPAPESRMERDPSIFQIFSPAFVRIVALKNRAEVRIDIGIDGGLAVSGTGLDASRKRRRTARQAVSA